LDGFFKNFSGYVSVVINNGVFSDKGKIFCGAFISTDNAQNGENKNRNCADSGSNPAKERNDCNKSAKKSKDVKAEALVDVIADKFGVGLEKKADNYKKNAYVAKSGKDSGSLDVFGVEHFGVVVFRSNGCGCNGFAAMGAETVIFGNLGSAFRTKHGKNPPFLLWFYVTTEAKPAQDFRPKLNKKLRKGLPFKMKRSPSEQIFYLPI
jgi:hypothetical protein